MPRQLVRCQRNLRGRPLQRAAMPHGIFPQKVLIYSASAACLNAKNASLRGWLTADSGSLRTSS